MKQTVDAHAKGGGTAPGLISGFEVPIPFEVNKAPMYSFCKRAFDIAVGVVIVILLMPILPLVALMIKLDTPGPVFFKQDRVGENGRIFKFYKFRSMVHRADEEKERLSGINEQEGPVFKIRSDPRITSVGRFLRRSSLDEIPQMFNVLKGDMSIVGPRPERPEFIAELQDKIPFYRTRLVVKPGLTGWAQIHYGYGNTVEDALIKLQYDLYYIRHWSLWMELYVIFKTIGVMLRFVGT